MTLNILGICGSLRAESINLATLEAAKELAPAGMELAIVEIGNLPHYNSDLDGATPPAAVTAFKNKVIAADGLLLATPEYNYGMPGVLKNAIDWVSRPAYRSPLAGKPVAIVGASPSPVGTARAQTQLKQVLSGTVSHVFPWPEVLISGARGAFDDAGNLSDDAARSAVQNLLTGFASWVRTVTNGALEGQPSD